MCPSASLKLASHNPLAEEASTFRLERRYAFSLAEANMKSDRLANRVAIVTGASRRIGSAIATNLARNGAKVVLTARDNQKLGEVVTRIWESGNEGVVYPADLREIDAPQHLVEAAVAQFGGIHIVVNNAGATRRGALAGCFTCGPADTVPFTGFGRRHGLSTPNADRANNVPPTTMS
jgi:NAD(P)-dependent dehydrogenase (short-subunit alcohol dehydrogenase family)